MEIVTIIREIIVIRQLVSVILCKPENSTWKNHVLFQLEIWAWVEMN